MAGHSHAANIMYRKAAVDRKRSKAFSKLTRMLTVAARLGGGDPAANPRLRLAIEKARVVSMTKDTIERAIQKGTGASDGAGYEDLTYEGYGPGGVAVILELLTDNKHRTAPEIRNVFDRWGGNLGATGSVSWIFDRVATFLVAGGTGVDETSFMEIALAAGAEDLVVAAGGFEIRAAAAAFLEVKQRLEASGVQVLAAEVGQLAKNRLVVGDPALAQQVVGLLDELEDHDDVQHVYSNAELPAEGIQRVGAT